MEQFKNFLQELSDNTKIGFNISYKDGDVIFKSSNFVENSSMISVPIYIDKRKANINLENKFSVCSSLLKYTIENKYNELYFTKEQIILDTLYGKNISNDKILNIMPFLSEGCFLLLISVDKNINEALNLIRQIYKSQDIISLIDEDKIILIGSFSEVNEHIKSIREAINSNLFIKCTISFSNIFHDRSEMVKTFNEGKQAMMFGKIYSLKEDILDYNKLFFEKIVYFLDENIKQELLEKFKQKFNEFDYEMINTIEEFFDCGLNITDAARKLYIHRNTLIYRLSKIEKETGFDIRNFKDSIVFVIAFLVWRENKEY